MLGIKSIMTKEVIAITKDCPIYKAIEILLTNQITGMPVVEDNMHLLGILTEKDLLRVLYDSKCTSISDLMTKEIVTFDENDDLVDLVKCLIEKNFRRIPITSKGKVVGIVSRTDIIRCILLKKAKEQKQGKSAHKMLQG
ncbi:MAG: CBS domain-containing protein [bacterium]